MDEMKDGEITLDEVGEYDLGLGTRASWSIWHGWWRRKTPIWPPVMAYETGYPMGRHGRPLAIIAPLPDPYVRGVTY